MSALSKLSKLITRPSYAFGRFRIVRKLYSRYRRLMQVKSPDDVHAPSALYPTVDIEMAIGAMRRDSYTLLPVLDVCVVRAILEFAKTRPLQGQNDLGRFLYSDVISGRIPDGRPVAMAHVLDCIRCPEIAALRDDPTLAVISKRYLGYTPTKLEVNLYWSFHVEMLESERRAQHQTIDFHFDVHDFNFSYYHLYVTDTTTSNGAHVLVRGSHIRKPFRWLWGSARQTDAKIAVVYPPADIVALEGPAGTAFIEDTSCYHKAIPPAEGERLLLQIRYH